MTDQNIQTVSVPSGINQCIVNVLAEVARQDRVHPAGYPSTRDGLRLGLAVAEDELVEARDEWRSERCKCEEPGCAHAAWYRTHAELVQLGAIVVRMLRSIELAAAAGAAP